MNTPSNAVVRVGNRLCRIEPRARPAEGIGSASPRYELRTLCCNHFFAADDDLSLLTKRAERMVAEHAVDDASALLFVDHGPRP